MGFSSTVTLSIVNFAFVTLAEVISTPGLQMRREQPKQVNSFTLEERLRATEILQERLKLRERSGSNRAPPPTPAPTPAPFGCNTAFCKTCVAVRARTSNQHCATCYPGYSLSGSTCSPFGCNTAVCKTCVAVRARTSDQHCATCRPGYSLSGSTCSVTICEPGMNLHIDELGFEMCVDECPPGMYAYVGGNIPLCTTCNGVSRRRRAAECTDCPAGNVAKTESDDCQNVQDTCTPELCGPCRDCLKGLGDLAKQCATRDDGRRRRRGTTDVDVPGYPCFDPGRHWCHGLIEGLAKCLSLSFGCYFKLLCQDPCVCPIWKEAMCGGEVGTGGQCTESLLQTFMGIPHKNNTADNSRLIALVSSMGDMDASAANMRATNMRMQVDAAGEHKEIAAQNFDDTLQDKCQG